MTSKAALLAEQDQLERLMEHPGWAYLQRIAARRIDEMRDMLEALSCGGPGDQQNIGRLQGELRGLRALIEAPHARLREIERDLKGDS